MSNDLSKDAAELRRLQGQQSLLAFAKFYLAHHVSLPPSAAHREIYAILLDLFARRGSKLAIAAPRGFGKSTLVTLIYVLYCICYIKERFIVILSATVDQAQLILDSVKTELTDNQTLLADFPELAGPRPSPWTRDEIETPTHIRVLALSAKQQIRGRKYGQFRPTLVIGDDIELADNTFSSESRQQLQSWVNRAILKAGDESANYLFIGTLYHPWCLLGEYLDPEIHPRWQKKLYKAIVSWSTHPELWAQWSRIYYSRESYAGATGLEVARTFYEANRMLMEEGVGLLWPERWNYYQLMEKRNEDELSFDSEYQNEPINPRDCLFDIDKFTYWDAAYKSLEELLSTLGTSVEFCGACDPSMGQDTVRGDFTAIVILAKSSRSQQIYIIVADIARRTPTQTIEAILAYYRRFKFRRFAIEANQFQALLAQELKRRAYESRLYPPIEEVKNTVDKVKRIQALHPLIQSGLLQFSKSHQQLLAEARFFPKGKHDDGLDALEMALRMAERREPNIRWV